MNWMEREETFLNDFIYDQAIKTEEKDKRLRKAYEKLGIVLTILGLVALPAGWYLFVVLFNYRSHIMDIWIERKDGLLSVISPVSKVWPKAKK